MQTQDEILVLEVTNTKTWLLGFLPSWLLKAIERETSYPTQTAHALATGFEPPSGGASGGWDGWIRLLRKPKRGHPWIPTGLIPYVQRICQQMDVQVDIQDKRERPLEGLPERWEPIPLFDYQKAAVKACVASDRGRGVVNCPPRAGKTRILLEVFRQIALPTLWVAPTDGIVRQTVEAAKEFFTAPGYVVQQRGAKGWEKHEHAGLIVTTAATAVRLPQEFYDTRQMIVCDEIHHGGAKSYHKISELAAHCYYRFGMTGTFFRSGDDTLSMHAMLSNVLYKISTAELIKLGRLVPTHVVRLDIGAPPLRGVANDFVTGCGKAGIFDHKYRTQLAAAAGLVLLKSGRSVVILVGTKAQGRRIQTYMSEQLPPKRVSTQFETVELVNTDRHRDTNAAILDSFRAGQEVRVIVGTSMIGEGVDLPVADALVYAAGGKAEVSLTQSAFRVATAMEGKPEAILVDFLDDHHSRLRQHSDQRFEIFQKEPLFTTYDLPCLEDFGAWVAAKS